MVTVHILVLHMPPMQTDLRASSPRSDGLSQSLPASRSRSPSSSLTPSLSSSFLPSSAEMDLGPQVASLSMGHHDGATGGHPSESISMDDHPGSSSTGLGNSLPPPIRTRRKELFVEPMPDDPMLAGPTSMNGVENLGSHSAYVSDIVRSERSGFKRKRESSPDSIEVLFGEDQPVNLGQDEYRDEITQIHLDRVTRTEALSCACVLKFLSPYSFNTKIISIFSIHKRQGQRA
jgi:hypothetical protein